MNADTNAGRVHDRWRLWAALVGVAAIVLAYMLPLADWLAAAEDWIRRNPGPGAMAYLVGCAVGAVLFMPGSVIGMVAGYLYGLPGGVLLAAAGAGLGALTAYLSARTLARGWVFDRLAGHPRLQALDRALYQQSFLIVLLTRLSLVFPYSVLNYLFGMTGVRKVPYLAASVIGLAPNMALWVYLGSLARNFDELLSGDVDTGPYGRAMLVAGLVALLVAVAVISRAAGRALNARMPE